MARYSGGDGMTRVVFALTIADIAAPTVAELDAASDWSQFITKDGLSEPSDQNNVDAFSLSDTFNRMVPGSFGGVVELTIQRDNATDTVWEEVVYGLEGFIAIRSGVPVASAWAAADDVRVYPGTWHEPVSQSPAQDTLATFTASFPVSSQPNLKAVVAV